MLTSTSRLIPFRAPTRLLSLQASQVHSKVQEKKVIIPFCAAVFMSKEILSLYLVFTGQNYIAYLWQSQSLARKRELPNWLNQSIIHFIALLCPPGTGNSEHSDKTEALSTRKEGGAMLLVRQPSF